MRFLIVDTCYPAFLKAHYGRQPGLEQSTYAEQWDALMATSFGTADAYSHFLSTLGHAAHEVVVDCVPLQRAWASEHELGTDNAEEILLAQVEDFRPEVVYLQNLHVLSDATMERLRSSDALVVGQIASEPPSHERLRMFDLILTSFPHFVDRFRQLGVASEYFKIGFDPRILDRLGPVAQEHEVVFAGALNRLRHRRGNEILAKAARELPLEFWGYDLRGWPPWSIVKRRYRGEVWGIEMYRLLASAKIALNRHIGAAAEYANNMRLYEATGAGTMLITDDKTNIGELFEPDLEVVVYSSPNDLIEKVRHYLSHEDERRAIAAAGQARTLRDHSYANRMHELVEIVERHR